MRRLGRQTIRGAEVSDNYRWQEACPPGIYFRTKLITIASRESTGN